MLTYSLSHQAPLHFGVNTYGLFVFGNAAAEKLSSRELGASVAVCAVGASACHMLVHPRTMVLGASGGFMGLVTMLGLLEPQRQFRMLLPWPGATVSMLQVSDLFLLTNVLGFVLLRHRLASVAWAAHLGGTAAGLGLACGAHLRGDGRFSSPIRVHKEHFREDWQRSADSLEAAIGTAKQSLQR